MVISFDKLPAGAGYPITGQEVKRVLTSITPDHILSRIRRVHLGRNRITTQEARIVQRGSSFTIRVNFWLEQARSRVLSRKRSWVDAVQSFGGIVTVESDHVRWSSNAARRYAAFLIAHEIAHVVYWQDRGGEFQGRRGGTEEEIWCDRWARQAVERSADILEAQGCAAQLAAAAARGR